LGPGDPGSVAASSLAQPRVPRVPRCTNQKTVLSARAQGPPHGPPPAVSASLVLQRGACETHAVCCASCSLISGCVAKGSLQYSLCRGIKNPYLGTHTYSTLRYTAHSPHHSQQLCKTSSSAPWTTPLHPDTKNLARRPALCSRARISPDDLLFVHRPPRASKQRISETALENSSENLWRKGVHMLKLDPTPSLWIIDRVIRGRLYWKGR
jgi:hypothetical protein